MNDMYQVLISGYYLTNVSSGKPYYVYTIELLDLTDQTKYIIEKRYSEFSSLHNVLKKNYQTAPFPPKRVRNSNPKVLEQRRVALEIYIQTMLKFTNTKQQVLNFLGVDEDTQKNYGEAVHNNKYNVLPRSLSNHPVLTFQCDPYVNASNTTNLPDIVTNGVLLGIYKS
ncbi:sorting nexin-24-like isoform X1 [Copidosoma floridanum]|uniref:sorting nexin-24-like isoform X1 n=1 Tax=Copidosoma floridanum TaxID=29053 RepID=UPI000C6FA533|nr:sorting nexin-24-like isoform X1 [Copidosoma floridanum]XP_023246428.1 sorting nexin-24-like isoform X1 [Copidosoma floridanum]